MREAARPGFRVAALTAAPAGATLRPIALIERALADAAAAGARLLVTPELATIGGADQSMHPSGALPSDDPALLGLAGRCAAHRIGLVLGYLERCSGRVHSAALVIDPAGRALGNYRRCHVAAADAVELARGQWLSVVPFDGWRLGLMIGHDLQFPETARGLALAGANLLVHLADPRTADGVAAELAGALATSRAAENGLPLVSAGRLRPDPSPFRDPDGRSLGQPLDPVGQLWMAELVADAASEAARAALLDARRPRLYRLLALIDEGSA